MNQLEFKGRHHILLLCFLTYLFIGTGFYSDDFIEFVTQYNLGISSISEFFYIDTENHHVAIFNVFSSYFHRIWLLLFGDNYIYYFIPKVIVSYVAVVLLVKFFSQYCSPYNAAFISILFVLFPLHDATNYWYSALKYTIVPAIVLYGFYLVNQEKYKSGFVVLVVGSFYGFSSPAYSLGMSSYFLLKKEFKKFFVAVVPGIFYIVFYFLVTVFLSKSEGRIESGTAISAIIKQYILQIGTFFDTVFGPSFWLKLVMSISQITLVSTIIAVALIGLFWKFYKYEKVQADKYLLFSLILVVLLGMGIFSLTGYYPQMAFNLGDRVTIYSSLLLSFIIVGFLLKSKLVATIIFSIFIFATLGISDHWKEWNKQQLYVIENIKKNKDLQEFDTKQQLFVIHNQYSKLGSVSHIEFFAQGMAAKIFQYALDKNFKVSTLNRRFQYHEKGYLLDKKYGTKIGLASQVYIYDSQANKLITIDRKNIQEFINELPKDNRHWLQLLDNNNFLMRIVIKLMPRLEYAL